MSAPRCGRSVTWGIRMAQRQPNGEGFLSLFCSREVEKYKTISANFLYQMNARMEFLRTTGSFHRHLPQTRWTNRPLQGNLSNPQESPRGSTVSVWRAGTPACGRWVTPDKPRA